MIQSPPARTLAARCPRSSPSDAASGSFSRKPAMSSGALGRKNSKEKTGARPRARSSGMSIGTRRLYHSVNQTSHDGARASAFSRGGLSLGVVDELLVLVDECGIGVEQA